MFRWHDKCHVYVVRSEREAVLIDFGGGDVLDHLAEISVARATDVLLTHHHRDQAQGLARAVEAGINIWVPHTEQDLFATVDAHWQARELYNNYNMRQD
ncbi:MAG: MBL fold metallo-hydrolase, partial [Chloroflexi bacterium]|nr:MBL fold metallo-hydrolase [Chloroflexota bacterium]